MTQMFDKSDIHYFEVRARNYEALLHKALLRDSFDVPRKIHSVSYLRAEYKRIRKSIYSLRKAEMAYQEAIAKEENQQFTIIQVYPNVT